jgi:hypothetical protein
MLYVRYVHLTKAKDIRKRQTHPVVREDYDLKGSAAKKYSGHEPQEAWLRKAMIISKLPVVKQI